MDARSGVTPRDGAKGQSPRGSRPDASVPGEPPVRDFPTACGITLAPPMALSIARRAEPALPADTRPG